MQQYGMRYAFCGAFGIVTANEDTDGNTPEDTLTAAEMHQLTKALEAKGRSAAKLCEWAGVDKIGDVPRSKFTEAMQMLGAK
jgi:hypothetical protein